LKQPNPSKGAKFTYFCLGAARKKNVVKHGREKAAKKKDDRISGEKNTTFQHRKSGKSKGKKHRAKLNQLSQVHALFGRAKKSVFPD